MKHMEILAEAVETVGERGKDYGQIDENFDRIRTIFFAITGVRLSSYQAAMFLVSLKLARLATNPEKKDSFVDGINYLAFAGKFAIERE